MSTIRMKKIWLAALLLPVLAACGTDEAGDTSSVQSVAVERGDLIVTAAATGVLGAHSEGGGHVQGLGRDSSSLRRYR